MGFFTNILSATVKAVTTPIAVVEDAADILSGNEPKATEKQLKSIAKDVSDAVDDVTKDL
jgi:hypothetical protein